MDKIKADLIELLNDFDEDRNLCKIKGRTDAVATFDFVIGQMECLLERSGYPRPTTIQQTD